MTRVRRPRPRIFIASSAEGEEIANTIADELQDVAKPRVWRAVFHAAAMTLPTLLEESKDVDFGVVVATPDEEYVSRGELFKAARDNVLVEAGIFFSAVGLERTLIVHPTALKIPSDLKGFNTIPFEHEPAPQLESAISSIRQRIDALGKRGHVTIDLRVYAHNLVEGQRVRLSGTLARLHPRYPDWGPGVEMDQVDPPDLTRWHVHLEAPEGTVVEYKYMAGPPWNWSHVETSADGKEVGHRNLVFERGHERFHEEAVPAWA